MRIVRHSIALLILLGLSASFSFGQSSNRATFTGTVVDAETGEGLPGANIFLSQTLLGSSTSSEGAFTIQGIPTGSYEVIASMIGYQPVRVSVQFETASQYEYAFELKPVVLNLSEIEVVDSQPRNWKKNLRRFKKSFLGTTKNSESCELINPEYLSFDVDNKVLSATASQPLIIENASLGYRVTYILDSFSAGKGTVSYKGLLHFEEMAHKSKKDSLRRANKRQETYNGSLMHYLYSMKREQSGKEGFISSTLLEPGSEDKSPLSQPSELLGPGTSPNRTHLNLQRYLEITYTHETEEMGYVFEAGRESAKNQVSWVGVLDAPAEFYPSGLLANPYSIQVYGYWAWLRVCDMLPVEFGLTD